MALSLGVTAVASTTSGTTVTTPARTTTPGSTIVLCGDWNTGDPFVSFTDSKGNTWTQIQTELGASPRTRMYYAENILGGTNHTFTLTITSAGQPSIWMVEIRDAKLVGAFDLGARQADAASPFTSPGIATTDADEFLVGFMGGDSVSNPATHTAGASMTLLDQVTNGASFWPGATAYRIVTATGTYNSSFTEVGAGNGRVWIAAFKAPPIQFVNGGSNKTTDSAHSSPVVVTIPATVAGNDLVVMVENGEDPAALPTVSSVTATGATFVRQGGVQNTSGTDGVNAECWVARNVAAGITSVSVAWTAAAVGTVSVAEYSGVQALGPVVTATGNGTSATIALTTQDAENVVVAGLGDEDTAQPAFSAASSGTFRSTQYALGDGSPDVNGCLIDKGSATPASVVCTVGTPATASLWAAVALELRSVAGGASLTPNAGATVLAGVAPTRVIGTILTPTTP